MCTCVLCSDVTVVLREKPFTFHGRLGATFQHRYDCLTYIEQLVNSSNNGELFMLFTYGDKFPTTRHFILNNKSPILQPKNPIPPWVPVFPSVPPLSGALRPPMIPTTQGKNCFLYSRKGRRSWRVPQPDGRAASATAAATPKVTTEFAPVIIR